MSQKLTLYDIEKINIVLGKIAEESFPVSLSYKFLKILRIIAPDMELLNEQRRKFVKEYAVKDDNGEIIVDSNGGVTIDKKHQLAYQEKVKELHAIEVDTLLPPITLKELEKSSAPISPLIIDALYPIIIE